MKWHTIEPVTLFETLRSSGSGLTEDEAKARMQEFGPNTLPEQPPTVFWKIILRQFYSPLIYVLLLAALLSIFIGDLKDAGFIIAVLVLNAIIGSYQEWKAEKSGHALRKLLRIRASVYRSGEVKEIPAEDVVPGDIVWIESGNRVPADLRLLSAYAIEVDESLLTGESFPVVKDPSWSGPEDAPLGDRANMAFAGTIVTRGRSKGIVVATGVTTSVGQLALDVIGRKGGSPPIIERMERFTKVIAVNILAVATFIGLLGFFAERYQPSEMFLFIVALAVSAIPEGLPVAMTVALAVASVRMAKRGVIVRRLTAVEGLGSCTLIATDKTGTLTVNELTVQEVRLFNGDIYTATGEGFVPNGQVFKGDKLIKSLNDPYLESLVRAGLLCNEAELHQRNGDWKWRGDTVDIAMLSFAYKLGRQRESVQDIYPQVNEIPFESEYQYAATFNKVNNETKVFVKGAPERVLSMCRDLSDRTKIEAMVLDMASRGLRVLALADGLGEAGSDPSHPPKEPNNLSLLGFVGMIDPLRSGVKEAIQTCYNAGIKVCMITGDHKITAMTIAQDLNLISDDSQVIDGQELIGKSSVELSKILKDIRVFSRVAPHQKLQIVEAACKAGHFVAVTGDGVNDAPALRSANIGVAMGKGGTDVAREAAELVISDDNFSSIVSGIEEGRIAYDNIRKVIYLLISTGAAELVLMGLAVLIGLPLPLFPVQILWLNLVTNGIQDIALAFDPGDDGVLKRKPRQPRERIFNQLMIERTAVAAFTGGVIGFGAYYWMIANGWGEYDARNMLLLFMVLFEIFHIGNCLSETKSVFTLSLFRRPILLVGTIIAFLVHIMAMHFSSLQRVLETKPVTLTNWLVVVALAVLVVPALEFHKWLWMLREKAE